MIPFTLSFEPGLSLYEQVTYAAKKAIVSGRLRPGDPFPSVRALSREFKINPNTAHKVIAQLTSEGLIDIRPGLGAFVAGRVTASKADRRQLLQREMQPLVVEAKKLGLELDELLDAIVAYWRELEPSRSKKG